MKDFTLSCPTKVIFGRGTEAGIGKETKKYSSKILLHFGGGSIKRTGLYDMVIKSLKEEDIEVVELGGVKPNPRLSLIKQGIELCKKENIGFILAVGGGSVIDSAKAIAVGACYDGDVWDFFTGKATLKKALPLGTILTIPAAGSESSVGMVITNEDGWLKRVCGSELISPKFSILNPEISFTLTKKQVAEGIADILVHIMERYFTMEKNVDLTDRLCEGTMKSVIDNGILTVKDLKDYNPRAEIMLAGTIAQNESLGPGRVHDWASHMIEHELSGIYDIVHGAGLAVIFPAWMKYVYKENLDIFAQFAVRVWGVDMNTGNPELTALEGISRLEDFFREIGLATNLKEIGIDSEKFEEMAKKCTAGGPAGNFKKLNKEDVLNIYKLAAV